MKNLKNTEDQVEAKKTLSEIDKSAKTLFDDLKLGKINTIFVPIVNQPSLWKFWTWHKRKVIRRRKLKLYNMTKSMLARQAEYIKANLMFPSKDYKPEDLLKTVRKGRRGMFRPFDIDKGTIYFIDPKEGS